jgi:hypothetical protein
VFIQEPGLQEPLAEHISGESYSAAQPDGLKDDAARIVKMYNEDRTSDVMRIAAQKLEVPFEEVGAFSLCL